MLGYIRTYSRQEETIASSEFSAQGTLISVRGNATRIRTKNSHENVQYNTKNRSSHTTFSDTRFSMLIDRSHRYTWGLKINTLDGRDFTDHSYQM